MSHEDTQREVAAVPSSHDDIVRRYHESLIALRRREAEEIAKLSETMDPDVRRARVMLAVPQEMRDEHAEAVIAFDEFRLELDRRLVEAHEAHAEPFQRLRVMTESKPRE